jgi:DNA-binding beta-propeller fold protein YncE
MKQSKQILLVVAGFVAAGVLPVQAQRVPQIPYTAEDALSDFPDDVHMGEAAGVARNSDGEIFVYTRTGNPVIVTGASRYVSHGGSRLFHFDDNGELEGEFGQETYGALYAQQVRISADDHIWTVDQMSGQVIRYDTDGRIVMVMSRKPEPMRVPQAQGRPNSGEGREGESFQGPTDITWDSQGNFYVADGIRNARIAKYDVNGMWVMNWGTRGNGPGEFDVIQGIAIDNQDNLYVADYLNQRIQVFDTMGNFQREMRGFGSPMTICITPGPNQVMYVSNSNPPDDLDIDGEIYKVELDGTIVGQFGTAGKQIGQFGTVNAIDCQEENDLLVGELGNWRVQRVTLRPM